MVNPNKRYTVGDILQVRVDLVLACGAPRQHGGDEVRIWYKNKNGTYSAPAFVTDLNNGSYLAQTPLR